MPMPDLPVLPARTATATAPSQRNLDVLEEMLSFQAGSLHQHNRPILARLSFENTIPQSTSVMNLAFGLGNFLVGCQINFWKILPLVDKILSFIMIPPCTE